MNNKVRPIAIYLPQFHPIPENDEWWGKGFTEWTNASKAKSLFKGHYQPHLPADLGFYDLRVPEIREAQAQMAREYGIYGFCYYHYWFNGRRILERPFQEVFESGKPDFPFMLCWANENWTRVWDGGEKNILLEQKYSHEDDRAHIKALIPYFKDERYIRVDGKPVFCIYRYKLFPDIKRTIEIFREVAAENDLELYLTSFTGWGYKSQECMNEGFDASVDFQPFCLMEGYQKDFYSNWSIGKRIINKIQYESHKVGLKNPRFKGMLYDYGEFVNWQIKNYVQPNHVNFPGVTPSWDNSARKSENFLIFKNSSPEIYGKWLKNTVDSFAPNSKDENFIFINAWNEWAEGNHLEPCRKWGTQYLQETLKALNGLEK